MSNHIMISWLNCIFFPFVNVLGFKGAWIFKGIIISLWAYISIFMCSIIYTIRSRRSKNKKKIWAENGTLGDLALWFYFFLILLFFARFLLYAYHYTRNITGCVWYYVVAYIIGIFIILYYFIYYCRVMSRYLNPKIYENEKGEIYYKDSFGDYFLGLSVLGIFIVSLAFQLCILSNFWKNEFCINLYNSTGMNKISNLRLEKI